MPTAVRASVSNPFWNTKAKLWFYDGTPGAGVTNGNAVAHPFAGSLGEQVIIFDGNNASHTAKPYPVGLGATETLTGTTTFGLTSPPDNTRRWGLRKAYLFRFTGTNTSAARIMQSRAPSQGLFLNTDLTTTFTFFDSLSVTESFTSLSALAADTWYMLDCWCVIKNSAGGDLPQMQLVIRASTLSAGAQGTVTTLINTLVNGTTAPLNNLSGGGASQAYGEDNTRGAGFSFYLGNVYEAWEDADDPYGVVRVDRLDPTAGNSAKNNQWTTAALGANVDESGTAEPDDATTIDNVSVTNTTKDQTYGLTNTVIATGSGDKIIRPLAALRTSESGSPPKGSFVRIDVLESDGTNNQLGAVQNSPVVAGTYAAYYQGFDKNPAGGAWDTTSLNSLEMGERADTNSTNPITYNLSTVTTLVAYQANGETMPAVPNQPIEIWNYRPQRVKPITAPMSVRPPRTDFGIFVTAAVAASTRRRSGWVS